MAPMIEKSPKRDAASLMSWPNPPGADEMSADTGRSVMEFHFIITLLFPGPNGTGMGYVTRNGTVSAQPGETRQDLFSKVLDHVCNTVNEPGVARSNVVFFALDRNELPVTA